MKRILLCRLGGIGDVMHSLPLAKYLRSIHNNASIEYLTSKDIGDLLLNYCPYIDKVWIYDKKRKSEIAKEIVHGQEIDYFISLHNSPSLFFFNLFYLRAKKFLQYKKENDFHAVVNFAKTYNSSISALNLDSKTLYANNNNDLLKKYQLKEDKYACFVIGVGKKRPHRSWAQGNWTSLSKKFLTLFKEYKIVLLGGKDEEGLNIPETLNLINKLTLTDSAYLISKASCAISCDTGLLHIASSLGTKVIGLYGPTLPKRTGPFSNNYKIIEAQNCKCINKKRCGNINNHCMDSINCDDVLDACLQTVDYRP